MKRPKATGGRESTRADVANSSSAGADPSKRRSHWEWIVLALILAVGAWLRFSHLDMLEFQGDEAYAANLALGFVRHGTFPSAGLMSSVGVTNPPLFIYLLIPMFALSTNPVVVSCCIACLALAAVVACSHIGRKYYGPVAGLVAAAFFAVSPWAVIYSRKVWAQDFVPIFATATIWAVHTLVLGKKPKAIFWAVLLPLCVVQIHFSGLALTAVVVVILIVMRPRIDWRFAGAGLAAAILVMLPYLRLQSQTGWADFRQAAQTVGGGRQWEQLQGVTTHPVTGYRLPSRDHISYALAIMNAGRIEDVLGISADGQFDRAQVWIHKNGGTARYFTARLTFGDWLLFLQRLTFLACFIWLVAVGRLRLRDDSGRTAWILVPWLVVPLFVFWVTRIWAYLTYFVILYPAHFLVCGVAAEKFFTKQRWLVGGAVAAFLIGNVVFMLDYYRFVGQNGGAQGTFGSGLGYKQLAARFLADKGGTRLRAECEAELQLATTRAPEERTKLAQLLGEPMLLELNHEGKPELPQLEWPLLVTQQPAGRSVAPTNMTVVLVDGNREALQPQQWQRWEQLPKTNFGPIHLYFASR